MTRNIMTICWSYSLRAIYGTDDQRNGLHGSDSFSSAAREVRFFFPDSKFSYIPSIRYRNDSILEPEAEWNSQSCKPIQNGHFSPGPYLLLSEPISTIN